MRTLILLLLPILSLAQTSDSCVVANVEYIFNTGLPNRFGTKQGFYSINLSDSTVRGYFMDGNVACLAFQDVGSPNLYEFHYQSSADFARIGYGTFNNYKHGVTITNTQTIINGNNNTIIDISDATYNPVMSVRQGAVLFEHPVVLKSPNGTYYKVLVDNSGQLYTLPY